MTYTLTQKEHIAERARLLRETYAELIRIGDIDQKYHELNGVRCSRHLLKSRYIKYDVRYRKYIAMLHPVHKPAKISHVKPY